MKSVKTKDYVVHIGENAMNQFDFSDYSEISILVDENTEKFCLPILIKKVPKLKLGLIIRIQSGEKNKTIETCSLIWKALTENNIDRNSLLINLGGGIIGDMGGFCASIYKRGVDFIHIPTTLLSMIDSSIGGKLGIDFNGYKNQIGIFRNPKSVLIYPIFLDTLSKKEVILGMAELLKHALIYDKRLWEELKLINVNQIDWEKYIYISIKIKDSIVASDPFEKKNRKKLNFGHTFAHAIESYYLEKGTPISHGEAVFMGIILESEMSELTNIEKMEIKNFILSNIQLPQFPSKSKLIRFMLKDKKNEKGKINFSLLEGIGKCTINNLFSSNEL